MELLSMACGENIELSVAVGLMADLRADEAESPWCTVWSGSLFSDVCVNSGTVLRF